MNELEIWLRQATRHLASDAAAKVRAEITEHVEAARDSAVAAGLTAEQAQRRAVTELGDPRLANCEYRRVLLTSEEARVLREGQWETRAVCSRPWLKRLALLTHLAILAAAAAFYFSGRSSVAADLFFAAVGMSPFTAAIFLPIDTPMRGFVFRCAKWVAMAGAIMLILGPNAMKYSWLLISCLGPMVWAETTRAALRRKLPIRAWPRHLYL